MGGGGVPGEINVALYDAHYFGLMVREHRMEAIECVCLPRQYVWLEKKQFVLELDLDVLRPMVLPPAFHEQVFSAVNWQLMRPYPSGQLDHAATNVDGAKANGARALQSQEVHIPRDQVRHYPWARGVLCAVCACVLQY